MNSPIIEIKKLTHQYNGSTAGIKDISLTIEKGEFIILAGKNGSGKTTFFRHLNGLMLPTSGEVKVKGKTVSTHLSHARQTIGMIFQDSDTQIVGETVFDDVAFGPGNLKFSPEKIQSETDSILKKMAIAHLRDRNPSTLSGGEKKRVAIAGVVAMSPEVIVFDEPFSNLDYPGTLDLLACIKSLHVSGHTIIIATHELEKVITCATRMIILEDGILRADGPPSSLVSGIEQFGIREPCASKLGLELMSWER